MKTSTNALVLERQHKDRRHSYYRNGLRSIHVTQLLHAGLSKLSASSGIPIKALAERFITYGLSHSVVARTKSPKQLT